MLYYFILAHQPDFDVVWCRGTVGEKIFRPWCDRILEAGGKILTNRRVSDLVVEDQGVKSVICGDERFDADAVIFSVGISGMQKIISGSSALQQFKSFRDVMNLGAIDVLATRLWLDRKIDIPRPSNACFGFDQTTGWTFFDLNKLHDEFRDQPGTVIEADFYHANQFLPLDNQDIIAIVKTYLATCIPAFRDAKVIDSSVIRLPKAVTHFSPGSYANLLRGNTELPNLFMSGDWIINQHGSWSQEKAYVTGLEAANRVIRQFNLGSPATILPVEPDEPHIQIARQINRSARQLGQTLLPNFWLP
jgi:uncharacterized protein with NAD-binding domain and iron-sulfur cluster